MTPNLVETRDLLHEELIRNFVVRSCLNCVSFDKKRELCLEFGSRPPATVVVFSCKTNWIEDVPF